MTSSRHFGAREPRFFLWFFLFGRVQKERTLPRPYQMRGGYHSQAQVNDLTSDRVLDVCNGCLRALKCRSLSGMKLTITHITAEEVKGGHMTGK